MWKAACSAKPRGGARATASLLCDSSRSGTPTASSRTSWPTHESAMVRVMHTMSTQPLQGRDDGGARQAGAA